jgi:hypothetical protein
MSSIFVTSLEAQFQADFAEIVVLKLFTVEIFLEKELYAP